MIKIGITGLHGTGKTTLLNALRENPPLPSFEFQFCDEVTRWVKSIGFDINENGGDQTQLLIVMKHIYNLERYDYMITDRTMLDCLIYSHYLREIDQISKETLDDVVDIYNKTINKYDLLFVLKPEFPMEDDGVRSVNDHFKTRIEELFNEHLDKQTRPVWLLTGSVENRVKQVQELTYNWFYSQR